MKHAKALAKASQPAGATVATSQYLKIRYSSKRYMLLQALADELGCSWQKIALAAIDDLLASEFPLKKSP